jgi:hypothetical protein
MKRQMGNEGLRELASGIDTLNLSGRASVPVGLVERLAHARSAAESSSRPMPVDIGGLSFDVAASGLGKYRYRLTHRNGVIGVTASEHLPAFRIQPRAEFLHGVGAAAAIQWFRDLLEAECGAVFLTVSRIDIHGDWQGWQPNWGDRERFLCRADAIAMRGERGELTGWEFGRRDTNTVCARIYDKTRQVQKLGIDYWYDIWGDRYDPGVSVLRVEFEFGRTGLRLFSVDTPDEAIEAAGGLWMAATQDWLTYRTKTDDGTRSRWPIAEEWRQVQRALISEGSHGLERMREGFRQGQLRTLAPGLVGYLSSFGALTGTTGVEDTSRALPRFLHQYELESGVLFSERIVDKVRRWML